MTSSRFAIATALALACALLATTPAPRAEVSAETEAAVNVLVLGVIEGPDPISLWTPVREGVDPALLLNTAGASREDGRPSIAFHPTSGWPHVSWALEASGEFHIAYAQWNGEGWSATELLGTTAGDDLDPRVSVAPDGSVWIAWWEEPAQAVWLLHKASTASPWSAAERVTGLTERGRRPSAVMWQGQTLVAYERNAPVSGQEVVLSQRLGPGAYSSFVVATTPSADPLDVMVHAEHGRLWVDWRHDDDAFAWVEWQGTSWGPVQTMIWSDDSWAGLEAARKEIAAEIAPSSEDPR